VGNGGAAGQPPRKDRKKWECDKRLVPWLPESSRASQWQPLAIGDGRSPVVHKGAPRGALNVVKGVFCVLVL
jgi:hypothetical protein